MKNIIMGMVIGLSLGIAPVALSYYSGSTKASDLTASELRSVIEDALSSCTISTGGGLNYGDEYKLSC